MKSDIEIARSVELKKIKQVAESIGIPREEVENYGRYIAKIPEQLIDEEKVKKSNLVLVTAITATKAGIGKTTVSIGLALGLNKIGKKAIVALREPSLGPCFGMKGGAAGGGYAQVLPMEKINLRLQAKYKAMEENEVRYEALACDDADYVIVAFGSSARICSATVEMARAEGIRLGMLRPITLYPFPTRPIAELAARVKGFLSVELNAGQMVEDVRLAVNGAVPVEHYGRQGGMIYSPDEVLAALKEKLIKA